MKDRGSLSKAEAIVIIVIAVAAVAGAAYVIRQSPFHSSVPKTTAPESQASSSTTTSSGPLTLSDIESLNSSWIISLGPPNSSKVIVVVYDPECPYCSLELNATLPFLYYVSENTSQARVIFLGLPIHEYSVQMLEILYEVYHLYGPVAFVKLLDANYAYYTRNIELYLNHETNQLIIPTNYTLIYMADALGYNVTQQESEVWYPAVEEVANFLLSHNISATPALLAFNESGAPVYYEVGLEQPLYIEGNLTERLGLQVPGLG